MTEHPPSLTVHEPQALEDFSQKPRWYVFHTFSGQENKVKVSIEKAAQAQHLQDCIRQIIIPTEEVIEIKSGQKKVVPKKKYPGYILVEMVLNDECWRTIRRTKGINFYFNEGGKPIPLTQKEVDQILSSMEAGAKPRLKTAFEKGQNVQVLWGPFADFTGTILEVNEDRGRLKALLSIFGRETPVELEFDQVKKI